MRKTISLIEEKGLTIAIVNDYEQSLQRMVLQGGKIPIRTITSSPAEKPTYSPLKMVRKQLRVHHQGFVRKGRTIYSPDIVKV